MTIPIKPLLACLAALALFAATALPAAHGASVRLRSRAVVPGTLIKLGDVAEVEDTDPRLVEKLRNVMLAPTPAAGRRLRLDFAQIRSKLAAQGINLATIDFSGSSLIEVSSGDSGARPAARRVSQRAAQLQRERAETLVAASVKEYLRGRAPQLGQASVSVELRGEDVPLVLSSIASGFQIAGGQAPWEAPQHITVAFMDRQENLHRIPAVCRIAAQPQVLVAQHAIPRGQLLRESDLTWKQMDVAEPVLSRLEDAVGRETKRAIPAGAPIALDDVQSQELVRSNDIVKTYVRKGSITVTSYLKARSSGGLGDGVTLTTLDGRERVLARVVGLHEAEVVGSEAAPVARPVPSPGIQLTSGERFPIRPGQQNGHNTHYR